MQKLFDRRDLLKLAAALGGLIVLSRRGMAAPRGVDPRLRRAYLDSERFGQLHYWTVGQGPLLVLLHQSAQSSAEYAAIAPILAENFRVMVPEAAIGLCPPTDSFDLPRNFVRKMCNWSSYENSGSLQE